MTIDYMQVPPPHPRRYIPHPADHPYFGGAAEQRASWVPSHQRGDALGLWERGHWALPGGSWVAGPVAHAPAGRKPALDANALRALIVAALAGRHPADPGLVYGHPGETVGPIRDMPLPTHPGGEYFPGPVGHELPVGGGAYGGGPDMPLPTHPGGEYFPGPVPRGPYGEAMPAGRGGGGAARAALLAALQHLASRQVAVQQPARRFTRM
jgi:hypothetical protein